jgi:ubiquitin C-terminal hydrolase
MCEDDWFQPRQQADAAECLQYILDALHDALYRPVRITVHGEAKTAEHTSQIKALQNWSTFFQKEYSPIVKHFYGQNQIRIRCEGCGTVSERFEPWMMLKLPIPGGDTAGNTVPTLEACLAALHTPEQIDDYQCDTCKTSRKAQIQTRISKLPNILILTLKRFTNRGQKIRGTVDWNPNAVDFHPWMAFRRCPFTEVYHTACDYETFAVVEHLGSAQGGHYHTYVRSPVGVDQWVDFDDDVVGANPHRSNKDVVSPDAYILMMMPRTRLQNPGPK